ncbi:MAG: hypothetical protein JKX85_15245, partial [Phycisphaeraceae bacterium]|nr:hypothetical protein [Phycisphaeraceae bacterium]
MDCIRVIPTNDNDVYVGTCHDDQYVGTSNDERIHGLEGNDNLNGGGGSDTIVGGDGNDTLVGGLGDDQLVGDDGNDTLVGGPGDDFLSGGQGNDSLLGGPGNDVLDPGEGDNSAYGGEGNDVFAIRSGSGIIDGGEGFDVLDFRSQIGWFVDLLAGTAISSVGQLKVTGIEYVRGTSFDDELIGSELPETLAGGGGSDIIRGGGGDDIISGEAGNDTLAGGQGSDTLRGGPGDDRLDGGADNDALYGDEGNDTLSGGDGDDILSGFDGDDSLAGGAGNDSLEGDVGNDTLSGGDGDDFLWGGEGDDLLKWSGGNDTIYGGARYSPALESGDDKLELPGSVDDYKLRVSLISHESYYGDEPTLVITNIETGEKAEVRDVEWLQFDDLLLEADYTLSNTPPTEAELEYFSKVLAYNNGLRDSGNWEGIQEIWSNYTGYAIDQVFSLGSFVAVGLKGIGSGETAKEPVLVIRGTLPPGPNLQLFEALVDWYENADPEGIGHTEFYDAWESTGLKDWLDANEITHVTGHSQGAAQAQLLVAEATNAGINIGNLVTFNSPGINPAAAKLNVAFVESIKHYVTSGDIVQLGGTNFLPGEIYRYNFDAGFNPPVNPGGTPFDNFIAGAGGVLDFILASHSNHWANTELYGNPYLNDPSKIFFQVVNEDFTGTLTHSEYESPLFNYLDSGGKHDTEYLKFVLTMNLIGKLIEKVEGDWTNPGIAESLIYRGSAEGTRSGGIDTFLEALPLLFKYAVENPGVIADKVASFAIEAIIYAGEVAKEWGEDAWDSILNWTQEHWDAISDWTAEVWDRTKIFATEFWELTVTTGKTLLDAIESWSETAWEAVSEWGAEQWENVASWSAETWQKTVDFTDAVWEATKSAGEAIFDAIENAATTTLNTIIDFFEGLIQDGYVEGASLYVDLNGDGIPNLGEETGLLSDENGVVSGAIILDAPLIAIGGTNVDTGLSNILILSAPTGSSVINPLTSLIQTAVSTQGITVEEAVEVVKGGLGISEGIDPLTYDPIADENLEIQAAVVQVAALAILSGNKPTAFAEIFTIMQNAGGTVVDLSDPDTIGQIFDLDTLDEEIQQVADVIESIGNAQSLVEITALQADALADQPSGIFVEGNELSNALIGLNGDDTLVGHGGNDLLVGGDGNDSLVGSAGNDVLEGQNGDDTLDGGEGSDAARILAPRDNFTITDLGDGVFQIRDDIGANGTDTLRNVEAVLFDDVAVRLIGVNSLPTGSVVISGTARQGQILTASHDLDDVDGGIGQISYQWYVNDESIEGVTGATYQPGEQDIGKQITVTASYTDGLGAAESVTSAATNPVQDASILLHGTEEADYLLGSVGNDTLEGLGGRDTLEGSGGNDTLIGGDDIDSAVFGGGINDYSVFKTEESIKVESSASFKISSLDEIERIHFDDVSLAFDLDGNAGKMVKLLGVMLGKDNWYDKQEIGIGLDQLDNGTVSYEAMMDQWFSKILGPNPSNTQVAGLILNNL